MPNNLNFEASWHLGRLERARTADIMMRSREGGASWEPKRLRGREGGRGGLENIAARATHFYLGTRVEAGEVITEMTLKRTNAQYFHLFFSLFQHG